MISENFSIFIAVLVIIFFTEEGGAIFKANKDYIVIIDFGDLQTLRNCLILTEDGWFEMKKECKGDFTNVLKLQKIQ